MAAKSKTDYSKYILPAGAVIAGYFILSKFGLIPTAASQTAAADVEALDRLDYWQPNYPAKFAKQNGWKKYLTKYMKSVQAQAKAIALYKAKGVFNDDENSVYTILKTLQDKAQLSQLAQVFLQKYKTDLITYLKDFLNEKELSRIASLVKDLPAGVENVTKPLA